MEILYQDEWLVAVNKPAGYLVHPADEPKDDDLVAMKIIRDQIGERVYTIHRLDRPTCGVLLFAIDASVAKVLHRAFEERRVEKVYHAVVDGWPEEEEWICDAPLQKDESKPFKDAETTFRVLARSIVGGEKLTLVECQPKTGRFHQIRRHLLSTGFPIAGDYRYAGIERSDFLSKLLGTDQKMMLQARKLSFSHPVSCVEMCVNLNDFNWFSRDKWDGC